MPPRLAPFEKSNGNDMAATSVGNGNAAAATTATSGFEADYFNLSDLDFNFELRPVETSLTTSVAADPGNSQRVTRARTREQERPLSPFLAIGRFPPLAPVRSSHMRVKSVRRCGELTGSGSRQRF